MSQQVTPPSDPAAAPDHFEPENNERPIVWGLVAMLGVGLVIGLLAILGAFVVVGTLGLTDDDATATDSPSDESSMFLPTPSPTGKSGSQSPLISPGPAKLPKGQKAKDGAAAITLSAGQASVASMGRIDLVGKFPGSEGAVLQVQRKSGNSWSDFPVTATVNGGQFSTYIQTGRSGKNVFRMADTDSNKVSNTVAVSIGG